jgi:hypothetical protein
MSVHYLPSSQRARTHGNPSPDTGARKSGIDLYDSLADDSECTDELTPRIPAWELAAMLLVAAFIGVLLATGGAL